MNFLSRERIRAALRRIPVIRILLILAGTTIFTATKEWLEPADEKVTRPEATFELWRYRAGQDYTSAATVRKEGQIVSCKADPSEDVQEILFEGAEPLEKYDPDGYRYIYVVREYLEGAGAGSYTPVFGKLQTETPGADVTEQICRQPVAACFFVWYNDCTYVQSSPDPGLLRCAEIIPASHGLENKCRLQASLPFLRTWYNDCTEEVPYVFTVYFRQFGQRQIVPSVPGYYRAVAWLSGEELHRSRSGAVYDADAEGSVPDASARRDHEY